MDITVLDGSSYTLLNQYEAALLLSIIMKGEIDKPFLNRI
jgi:hypothetical protein